MTDRSRSASRHRVGTQNRIRAYFEHHQWVAVETLQNLLKQPLASALTWMVIAIALTLPGLLWVAVDNLSQFSNRLQASGSLTVYFDPDHPIDSVLQTEQLVQGDNRVIATRVVSADEGLADFKENSGLGDALALLSDNPLPHVLIVEPRLELSQELIDELLVILKDLDGVESVEIDSAWLERLAAILELARSTVWLLGSLLALAIVLVVGNTIRLTIATRVDEIRVMKLVGATNAWVRRPFLYMGAWYGAIGALLAWLLLMVSWVILRHSVDDLARLYGATDLIRPISANVVFSMLCFAIFLGWLGALWSVRRHLDHLEPTD